MKRTIIRLTEGDLHTIIRNSVRRILTERHVLEVPKDDSEDMMPQMDDPSMGMGGGDPMGMGGDPNMGADPMAGGDPNAMGEDPNAMGGEDPMGDPSMGDSSNPRMKHIQDMLSNMADADLKAAEGYIESLMDDNQGSDSTEGDSIGEDPMAGGDPNMGADPSMGGQPMQEALMHELNDILGDRQGKRDLKKIPQEKVKLNNPFISDRH